MSWSALQEHFGENFVGTNFLFGHAYSVVDDVAVIRGSRQLFPDGAPDRNYEAVFDLRAEFDVVRMNLLQQDLGTRGLIDFVHALETVLANMARSVHEDSSSLVENFMERFHAWLAETGEVAVFPGFAKMAWPSYL